MSLAVGLDRSAASRPSSTGISASRSRAARRRTAASARARSPPVRRMYASRRRAARAAARSARRAAPTFARRGVVDLRDHRDRRRSSMSRARAARRDRGSPPGPRSARRAGRDDHRRDAAVRAPARCSTDCGLKPSHTVNAARDAVVVLRAERSRVAATAPIVDQPRLRRRVRRVPASPILPVASMRCAPAGIGDVRADGDDLPVADEHRAVLDRRAAHRIDLAAGDGDRLRARAARSARSTRRARRAARSSGAHQLGSSTVGRNEAQLEVGAPLLRRIEPVEHHRAVDPHLLGARVDAERIARPEHDVGVLARLDRPDLRRRDRAPTPD